MKRRIVGLNVEFHCQNKLSLAVINMFFEAKVSSTTYICTKKKKKIITLFMILLNLLFNITQY